MEERGRPWPGPGGLALETQSWEFSIPPGGKEVYKGCILAVDERSKLPAYHAEEPVLLRVIMASMGLSEILVI